ncbi:hypothetical protein NA57DRAFT_74846 [Rhizodiscina lignyota]|uniref:Uncharacterized protein n=1 Tax=Rhizodiscina lignyota TaxID=1504668 RepID=A0A9P4IEC7_9PEZI|nr:hypothetical protein NA57DRAFT_74846 [Rhizodiscina lignyota]
MFQSLLLSIEVIAIALANIVFAQSSSTSAQSTGYFGYNLTETGDPTAATYDTLDTPANVSLTVPEPDVYLHANVHVGEIDILVANLSAKINLDAQVLQLLQFNAGVDASIKRVFLTIQNVTAEVYLEARLGNVVKMIGDVLDSLDLNPVLATLGQSLDNITDTVGGALGGSGSGGSSGSGSNGTLARRNPGLPQQSFELLQNILYSVNDYTGNKHTNRILAQNGDIVDEFLDNDGRIRGTKVVGNFENDMTFTGHNSSAVKNGQTVNELEYTYTPLPGVLAWAAVFMNAAGSVVATQVLAEGFGGGSSTID